MAKYDFSNLLMTPELVVMAMSRGYRITDEEWLGVIKRCRPPLIGRKDLSLVQRYLDPRAERRGRPRADGGSKSMLIRKLEKISRTDLPPAFLENLVARLRLGRPYTKVHSNRDYARRWRTHDRNMIIRGLYDQIYDLLDGDPPSVTHEILGTLDVPCEVRRTKSQKALELTSQFMRQRTVLTPPATSTMMKIISEGPLRNRRPRS